MCYVRIIVAFTAFTRLLPHWCSA
uniref:Uncharacterized protein n=1 Tax=Arundo donax TaxID=35708 RepID=A0A0A8ZCC8_ARUDO